MKKLLVILSLLGLLVVPTNRILAQENVVNSQVVQTINGSAIADEIKENASYSLIVKNQVGEELLNQTNVSFNKEQATLLSKMLKEQQSLSLDLGNGQYQLSVASAELSGNQLTFIANEKQGYSVVFHKGLVTQSGIIYEDSADAVITTVEKETSDLSEWGGNSTGAIEPREIELEGTKYWATQPYYEGVNGEVFDNTTTVQIASYTLSTVPYAIHFNIVPRVDAASSDETTTMDIVETTTVATDAINVSVDTSVSEVSNVEDESSISENKVQVSMQQFVEQATTTTAPLLNRLLPNTGESGNYLIWIAIGLVVVGAMVILLPKIRRK